MTNLSRLEGISSTEVSKLCGVEITTVQTFLARLEKDFNKGIEQMSAKTGIKPDRLIQFVPPERLRVEELSNELLEAVTNRVLRKAKSDDPWLKRCKDRLKRFNRGLEEHWLGWRKNLPVLVVMAGLLVLIVLAVRALGGLRWLPSPLGLRDQALVAVRDMEKDTALKSDDLYPVLLPLENDYFKPGDKMDGLILAQKIVGQMPLRFRDVLRQQVVALTDIPAGSIIKEEQIKLDWKPYQAGAALTLESVSGYKASQALRKDGVILSDFVKPAK